MATPRWLPVAAALILVLAADPWPALAGPVVVTVPRQVSGTADIAVTTTKTALARIEILVDRIPVATCPDSPCVHAWDTTALANGLHKVQGRVTQSSGRWWSVTVKVTVENAVLEPTPAGSDPTAPAPGASPGLPPAPDDVLAVLLGPMLAVGAAGSEVARYDATLVERGHQYAAEFPAQPGDLITSNYYDLALVLYTAYHRTQDPYWREQARRVALTWRDSPNNQAIPGYLAGDWSLGSIIPPPRGMASLGLAILALEAGDDQARGVVHLHARLIEERWVNSGGDYGLGNPVMPMGDPREAAYGLMALVASSLLGEDHTGAARRLLDAILACQQASGQWQGWVEGGQVYTNNFMTGLLMEALALYDRAIGDARIVPAVERAIAWTWSTQWVAGALSFKYDAAGTDPTPAPVLNGLFLAGWAHALARTGKTAYRDQGELILRGLVERGLDEIWSVKQFSQVYRASAQYLGVSRGM